MIGAKIRDQGGQSSRSRGEAQASPPHEGSPEAEEAPRGGVGRPLVGRSPLHVAASPVSLRDVGTVGTVLRKLPGLKPGLQPSFQKTEAESWARLRLTLCAVSRWVISTRDGGSPQRAFSKAACEAALEGLRIGDRGQQVAERGQCQCGGPGGPSATARRPTGAGGCVHVPQQQVPQDLLQDLLQVPGSRAAVEQPLLGPEVGGTARGGAPRLGILRQQMVMHLAGARLTPMTSLTVCQPQLRGGKKRCTHISALKPLCWWWKL